MSTRTTQISSRENPAWKMVVRLCHSGRERRKQGKCVLEGAHTIRAYQDRFGAPELLVIDAAGQGSAEVQLVAAASGRTIVADSRLFKELELTATATGIVAIVPTPQPASTVPGHFNVLLEDLQDPGNVGTILRCAAAAGVARVFLTRGCAFAWSPKVLRAAQGAHFHLDIVENAEAGAVAAEFSGRIVAAMPRAAHSLFDADLDGPLLLLVGNEGAGLSPEAVAASTVQVAIPMPGKFESLNAATATAICLFEKVRQDRSRARA